MAFQIRTSEGEPIPLPVLDEEAAQVWGVSIINRHYVTPRSSELNWYDTIGWHIHSPTSRWSSGWENIKCSMFVVQVTELALLSYEDQLIKLKHVNDWLAPFYKLIDHWAAKGYKPIKLDE